MAETLGAWREDSTEGNEENKERLTAEYAKYADRGAKGLTEGNEGNKEDEVWISTPLAKSDTGSYDLRLFFMMEHRSMEGRTLAIP